MGAVSTEHSKSYLEVRGSSIGANCLRIACHLVSISVQLVAFPILRLSPVVLSFSLAPMDATTAPAVRRTCRLGDLIIGPEAPNWARLLVLDHLDPDSRLALYCTCAAARDLMLVTAEKANVNVRMHEPEAVKPAELHAVRSCLHTRGKLRTRLSLSATDCWELSFALGVLEAGTTWLDGLHLHIMARERIPTALLATAGRCCPNLRVLELCTLPNKLPSPQLFSKLDGLHIFGPVAVFREDDTKQLAPLFDSIAPYVQQLTHLCLGTNEWDGTGNVYPVHLDVAPALFNPDTIAARLTTLRLPVVLNDTLLGLLIARAPALEELEVCTLWLETDTHAQAVHRWLRLDVQHVHVSSLGRLPLANGMEIGFDLSNTMKYSSDGPVPTWWCDIASGGEAIAARLTRSNVRMITSDINLWRAAELNIEDQSTALRLAIDILHTGTVREKLEGSNIALGGWSMSAELLRELRRLPRLSYLEFTRSLEWLPEPLLYATLLRLLPDSFHTIKIFPNALTIGQLESICLGAPLDRTQAQGLTIMIDASLEQVQAVRLKMRQSVFLNVRVASSRAPDE